MTTSMGRARRRARTRGPAVLAERWQRFARSLYDRYLRVPGGGHRLAMSLVRRFGPISLHSPRSTTAAYTLSPRIHLSFVSVGPGDDARRDGTPAQPTVRGGSGLAWPRGSTAEVRTARSSGDTTAAGDACAWARVIAPLWSRRAPVSRESSAAFPGAHHNGWMEVRRVFAGRADEERADGPPLRRREIPIAEEAARIVRRVVEGHQRTEDAAPSRLVSRLPQAPPERTAPSSAPEPMASPQGRSAADRRVPPALPPITIDQLTEQVVRRIDQRITAYRERLGKA